MMNEITNTELPLEKEIVRPGCLGQLGWFFSGIVLPFGSLSYYRKAIEKSVGSAILFFILFTLAISGLYTIQIATGAFSVIGGIHEAYVDGDIPEITISNGVAEVDGPQPNILIDERTQGNSMFVAVDTTGKLREIDEHIYRQGFLLTRTQLHMLTTQNGYQVLPLSDINAMFNGDDVLINAETVSQAWGIMAVIFIVFAFIFLVLWFTVVRLMIISVMALVFWGIVTLIKPNTGFGPILITGLYAIVPAIYVSHLFSRSGLGFPGLQAFFLVIFWSMGLLASLMDHPFFTANRSLRLWTALLGLPMLVLYTVDLFWQFPSPYDLVILWGSTALTLLVLIGVRLFFRIQDRRPAQQPVVEDKVV